MARQLTTIDLRGSAPASSDDGFGVLADPTGRRGRALRRAGRVVAALFAVWLAALALAGVGLLPTAGIPLASRGGGGSAPPPLEARSPLVAAENSAPALRPSATATATAVPAPAAARPVPAPAQRRQPARRRAAARGHRRTAAAPPPASPPAATPVATAVPRGPAAAPGKSVASPGHSGSAPGQTRPAKTPVAAPTPTATPTPSHGRSGSAPGRSVR